MSRSYKKNPSFRMNAGTRKKFRTDYNRYIRHKKTEHINGSHYKKTNASWHAYQFDEVFEGYGWAPNYQTMKGFEREFEQDIKNARSGVHRRYNLPLDETELRESYKARRYRHWKWYYRK